MRGVALQRPGSRAPAWSRSSAIPSYVQPCDPVLRKVPPSGDEWLYEIKWDGYRSQPPLPQVTLEDETRNVRTFKKITRRGGQCPEICFNSIVIA
jgi:ATP-dependent DNA ligase